MVNPYISGSSPLIFEMKWIEFDYGSYGFVFFSHDGLATKVFSRRTDADESHVESVFEGEVRAYELASAAQCDFAPKFYGCVTVHKIINELGVDISNQFYLHLSYQMQRIEGSFVKLRELKNGLQKPVIDSFNSIGIFHLCDASVIVNEGMISCIIDFSIRDSSLDIQHQNSGH